MELITAEHSSNWSCFNALIDTLIDTKVPFIFKDNGLLYLNNFISEGGIKFKGLKEGVWISSNRHRIELFFYLNDKRKSKSLNESKNFRSVEELSYVDDKMHFKYISWYENRQKKEVDYVNGKKHGKTIFWDENGQKNYEIDYLNGKISGKCIFWYKNGLKALENDYIDNKKHGKEIWWYENGQKKYEIDYIDGLEHGKEISWYENGQKKEDFDYVNREQIVS